MRDLVDARCLVQLSVGPSIAALAKHVVEKS